MKDNDQLIAHIQEHGNEYQSLYSHLMAVSSYTGQFANKFGLKETGEILGLLHDFGKASNEFQNYILSANGKINPDADGYIDSEAMRGKIDHSTAGAQVIYETLREKGPKEKIAAQVLALCIASHHSGLIDCLTPDGENNFKRRMEKSDEDTHKSEAMSRLSNIELRFEDLLSKKAVDQIFTKLKSLQKEGADSQQTILFKIGLLIRGLLSCLVDADRLDTADFESPGNMYIRNYGQYHSWPTLGERLNVKLAEFEQKEHKNNVDELRNKVSLACLEYAAKPKGIYQLTVPTGGGKTLASMRFALNHATTHQMDRIIYVIPYTSIIDQNANEIRKILEDKDENGHYLDRVVLEHHSNLTPEEESHRQGLLAQNWDAPVVLTTQVQFLEALFGSGTRGVRRMHQLANSVIILDEVQTIPINTIQMLNVALRFLVEDCGATVVLCTATQPPFDKIDAKYRTLTIRSDLRIIQNETELFKGLKRVEVFDERKTGGWSDEEIANLAEAELREKGSVLIVVNTKKNARLIYQAIADKKIENLNLRHLSTNMCPAHRLAVLEKVKKALEDHSPVICVSTQLIEAGVDIDFGAVIRYLAGLDSIAQSAGRCNRHGVRQGTGNVLIVNPKEENIDKLKDIVIGRDQAQRVLDEFTDNPEAFGSDRIGLEAMAAYYRYYYHVRKDEMRYKVGTSSPVGHDDDLFNLLSTNTLSMQAYLRIHQAVPEIAFPQSFQSAAKAFRVIDSATRGVVVQYECEGEEIVADLCGAALLEKQYGLLKRAQRYSVNLFPHEFKRLFDAEIIHEVQKGSGIFYLDKQYYSNDFGWGDEIINPMDFLIVEGGTNAI
ncbi:MAG: CRISPR-associated helicase Cas3' [Chloroflexi bacterium]|nr:CRISPR-associated helicase Cas3' [Chloroflexota bacterium]